MTLYYTTIVLAIVVGCAESKENQPTHRYRNPGENYSIDAPDGWSLKQDRGATIFAAPGDSKQTIAVRSLARPKELVEGQLASPSDIVNATEHVVGTLPQGRVLRRSKSTNPILVGGTFAVEFVPTGLTTKYQRIHAVLVGKGRVFHVLYTAPSSEERDDELLSRVIAGLREEV